MPHVHHVCSRDVCMPKSSVLGSLAVSGRTIIVFRSATIVFRSKRNYRDIRKCNCRSLRNRIMLTSPLIWYSIHHSLQNNSIMFDNPSLSYAALSVCRFRSARVMSLIIHQTMTLHSKYLQFQFLPNHFTILDRKSNLQQYCCG